MRPSVGPSPAVGSYPIGSRSLGSPGYVTQNPLVSIISDQSAVRGGSSDGFNLLQPGKFIGLKLDGSKPFSSMYSCRHHEFVAYILHVHRAALQNNVLECLLPEVSLVYYPLDCGLESIQESR